MKYTELNHLKYVINGWLSIVEKIYQHNENNTQVMNYRFDEHKKTLQWVLSQIDEIERVNNINQKIKDVE